MARIRLAEAIKLAREKSARKTRTKYGKKVIAKFCDKESYSDGVRLNWRVVYNQNTSKIGFAAWFSRTNKKSFPEVHIE